LILLGANGMFGRDAVPVLEAAGFEVQPADLPEVDIADRASLERFLDAHSAHVVLNAAAYTDVDGAETHKERALLVNREGARNVAEACRDRSMRMVHISSDYVFPGTNPEGYLPSHPAGPAVNAYGESKLEGERAIAASLPEDRYLICRTQWLYGRHGKNFVDTIAGLARSREDISVVDDQWGVPTHAVNLAEQIAALVSAGASGYAHTVGGGGPVTWFQEAAEIVRILGLSCRVNPCGSEAFSRPAKRPCHAWLRNAEVPAETVRPWKEALGFYLQGGQLPPARTGDRN
jgi:dTDP-4-dehydrorhamnose reductase